MRPGYFTPLLLSVLLLLAPPVGNADSWPGPTIKEVFSESREYFVRVLPGESLGDTSGFAGQKKGRYATAEFYRRGRDRSFLRQSITGITSGMAKLSQSMTRVDRRFGLTN